MMLDSRRFAKRVLSLEHEMKFEPGELVMYIESFRGYVKTTGGTRYAMSVDDTPSVAGVPIDSVMLVVSQAPFHKNSLIVWTPVGMVREVQQLLVPVTAL